MVTMKTKLDQIAEKETRREARNKGFEEERTSLEKIEKELAEILVELDKLERRKTRQVKQNT